VAGAVVALVIALARQLAGQLDAVAAPGADLAALRHEAREDLRRPWRIFRRYPPVHPLAGR
jgi:hypothetical protein